MGITVFGDIELCNPVFLGHGKRLGAFDLLGDAFRFEGLAYLLFIHAGTYGG